MKRREFSAFFLIAALSTSIHTAAAQVINATMQNASPRVVTTRVAPAAKSIANTAIAPHVAPRPTSFTPRNFNSYAPRAAAQSVPNIRPNYSSPYIVRSLNPTVAPISARRSARIGDGRPISLDPAVRERELHTLAAMHERRRFGTQQATAPDPGTRETELRTLATTRERRGFGPDDRTLAAINTRRQVTPHDPVASRPVEPREARKNAGTKKWRNKDNRLSFENASRRHWHEWHDRDWWHNNCDTIVFISTGYYFLDGSYWYPAWGYDPLNSYYDYDGPIYTYSNLLPDEVIASVQTALQDTGYYSGPIDGSLNGETRTAIANFQRDYGLPITGAIDEPTVQTLGLYQADDSDNFQTDQGY